MERKKPEECDSIDDVRAEIDYLDSKIIEMLGLRFKYVKEIVKYKDKTKESIVAKERYNSVLKERRHLARKNGLDPDVIEKVYRELIHYFINEELKQIDVDN